MITLVLLALIAVAAGGIVVWPIVQGTRRPWTLDVPSGEEEALRQEQITALEALRDLAMDYRLGNLSSGDYRALAAPLQKRARRTLEVQGARRAQRAAPAVTGLSLDELDALLEAQIRAARRVPTPTAAASVAGAAVRYCPECGVAVAPTFRFCAACGAKLPTGQAQPIPQNGDAGPTTAREQVAGGSTQGDPERAAPPITQRPVPAVTSPAVPSASGTDEQASADGSRRWLWWMATAFAAAWVIGIVWLYANSRAQQQNQTPVATLPGVPIQALSTVDGGLFLGEPNGVRASADGQTWTPLALTDDVRGIVPLDASGQVLLAVGSAALWRSQDDGAAWRQVETTPPDLRLVTLGVVPGQSGLLVGADAAALYASQDGGQTWQRFGDALPGRPRVLAPGTTSLFLGTDRGVYRSEDGGRSWINLNGSANGAIASTDVRALVYDDANGMLYAGTPAGLSFMNMSAPGGWGQRSLRADVTALALDGDDSQVLWVGAGDGRLFRSPDRGVTWR